MRTKNRIIIRAQAIVLILDGNSEMGAHVRSSLGYLIFLIHLERPTAVTDRIFFFSIRSMRAQHVLSYHLI